MHLRRILSAQPKICLSTRANVSGFDRIFGCWIRRFALIVTALSFAACSDSDPPQMLGYAPPPYGHSRYRPQADWEEDDAPSPDPDRSPAEDSQPEPTPPVTDDSNASPNPPDSTETQPDTSSAPAPTPANLPTAQSIGNGRVESPYAPGKQVDVEGFPPGSTVRDPYTGQLFLVPVPKTGP